MRISDWSSDVCSSDLSRRGAAGPTEGPGQTAGGRVAGSRHRSCARPDRYGCCLRARVRCCRWPCVHFSDKPGHAALRHAAAIVLRHNRALAARGPRSEEHTSELQSLMRISYAVSRFIQKKQTTTLTEIT